MSLDTQWGGGENPFFVTNVSTIPSEKGEGFNAPSRFDNVDYNRVQSRHRIIAASYHRLECRAHDTCMMT